jgi:hypothetical protein
MGCVCVFFYFLKKFQSGSIFLFEPKNRKWRFIMRKAIMIASLTAFAAVAAFAAPRNSDVPAISSSEEEVVILPIDDQNTVDEKTQDCGCSKGNKPKGMKRAKR